MSRPVTTHLVLKCIEPDHCSVVFEPLGSEVVLEAEDQLRLEIISDAALSLEVAYSPGCITVWLPGSVVEVRAWNRLNDPIDLGLAI